MRSSEKEQGSIKMSETPIKLRAQVKGSTGKTKHFIGTIVDGLPVPVERISLPAWVEIVEEDDAFYLLYFNRIGENIADTWHASLVEAQSQAEFEFRISSSDWHVIQEE